MKSHEAFPSTYLKAADLNGQRPVVTITGVTTEDLGGDTKRAVHFKGTDKILILNKTNFNMIAEITGQDDDDNWTGQRIALYATKVDFQGKRVDAIRVDYPPKASTAPTKGKTVVREPEPVEMPTADEVFGNGGMDDSVPF